MQIIITTADGTERTFACPVQPTAPISNLTRGREWKSIAVIGTADEVKAAFVDGITYRQQWESAVISEDGTQTTETQTRDLSLRKFGKTTLSSASTTSAKSFWTT